MKYVHQGYQGSTRCVTSISGTVIARIDYQSYGEQIPNSIGQRTAPGFTNSDSIRHRYALTENDEATGLNDTWFRKHENRSGRWTSPDPYNGSMSISDPQSFNRYSYVSGQPTNYVDPAGLFKYRETPGPIITAWDMCHYFGLGCGNTGDQNFPIGNEHNSGGGGPTALPPPPTDCNELAKQIKKFLNSLQRRARQIMQNLGNLEGPSLDIYTNRFQEEQQGLRNRLDEWNTGNCGGPGPTAQIPENAWKWATDPPPPPGISPTADRSQLVQVATGVAVTIGVAYVLYRIVRMVPSLAPPLWWTIPVNVAVP